jgi:hypothetical protein
MGVDGPDGPADADGRRRTAGRKPADRATDGRAGTTPDLAVAGREARRPPIVLLVRGRPRESIAAAEASA